MYSLFLQFYGLFFSDWHWKWLQKPGSLCRMSHPWRSNLSTFQLPAKPVGKKGAKEMSQVFCWLCYSFSHNHGSLWNMALFNYCNYYWRYTHFEPRTKFFFVVSNNFLKQANRLGNSLWPFWDGFLWPFETFLVTSNQGIKKVTTWITWRVSFVDRWRCDLGIFRSRHECGSNGVESQLDTATKKSPTLDLGISLENGFFKLQDNTQPPTISFPMHPCLFLNYIYIYINICETNGRMSGSDWLFPQLFPLRKLRWKSVGRSQSTRSLPRSGRLAVCWISLKDCWVGFQTFEALLPSVPAYTKHGFLWWFRWFMSKSFGPGASCFQAAWASGWEFSVEWED